MKSNLEAQKVSHPLWVNAMFYADGYGNEKPKSVLAQFVFCEHNQKIAGSTMKVKKDFSLDPHPIGNQLMESINTANGVDEEPHQLC